MNGGTDKKMAKKKKWKNCLPWYKTKVRSKSD